MVRLLSQPARDWANVARCHGCARERPPQEAPVIQKPLLFSGNSNRGLAEEIAKKMETRVGSALVDRFRNEECRIEIKENVRGAEVFVIQSLCNSSAVGSVNDALV